LGCSHEEEHGRSNSEEEREKFFHFALEHSQ
jgi:hypothetical protein